MYSARFELPELIEQGRDNALVCRIYRGPGLVTPTQSGSTITIYNASNTAIISAAAITVSSSVARYTLLSSAISSQSRGTGWRVEWSLVMPDGVTHVFRNDAALVLRRLYPVVTEADLYRRLSSLDPSGDSPVHSQANFIDKLDEVMISIEQRLLGEENRPNLVLSPSAFREVELELWIALILEDFQTRLTDAYRDLAQDARNRYEAAWSRLRWVEDSSGDDGQVDNSTRRPARRSVWLNGRF